MTHDLAYLVDRAMEDPRLHGMRPVVEKELLHYDILFALERGGFLDRLVFQGGTALRLCHGAHRYSEDLDFAGGADFTGDLLAPVASHLEEFLSGRYGLHVAVQPSEPGEMPGGAGPTVFRWRINVMTQPARADLPRQRIHLEITNISSHDSEVLPLARNYDFLPDGYEDMLIRVETKDEILADKLVAFPAALPRYPRWRDIWDMRWLGRRGAVVNAGMITAKIEDYRIGDFGDRLEAAIGRIPELVHDNAFAATMMRFLPLPVVDRTLRRTDFFDVVAREVGELLTRLKRELALWRDRNLLAGGQGDTGDGHSAADGRARHQS